MSTQQTEIAEKQRIRGERMLKTLHQLMQELIPLVDRIRVNLEESSTRMPDVSRQLNCVTQATEMATVEILNVLEAMTATITGAQRAVTVMKKNSEAQSILTRKISEQLHSLGDSAQAASLRVLWEEFVKTDSNTTKIQQIESALHQASDQCMSIAMSLQVQDITSQQIAGATNLIEQVEVQLKTALDQFDAPDDLIEAMNNSPLKVAVAKPQLTFDSQAVYTPSTSRQEEADLITKQFLGNQKP